MNDTDETKKIEHLAIIMDGNGRWAVRQGLRRIFGHEDGAKTVQMISRECSDIGIRQLTLYAFSYDNWERPKREVHYLMKLLKRFIVSERDELMRRNIRLKAIGVLDEMPSDVRVHLDEAIEMSKKNTGMVLCLALSYSGKREILSAAKKFALDVQKGEVNPDDLDLAMFSGYMYDNEMKDPDLLIRTGGDIRISDFLLWWISYTEIWITSVCWPDFTTEHLHEALQDFTLRDRKYGKVQNLSSELSEQ